MLKKCLAAAVFAGALWWAAPNAPTAQAAEVGDVAPEVVVEEWVNADLSPKKLRGRLIFYEMFRTW